MRYLKINSMAPTRKKVFGAIRYYLQWRHKSYLSSSEFQMQITATPRNWLHKQALCLSVTILLFAPLPPPPRGGRKKYNHRNETPALLLTFYPCRFFAMN